MSISKSTAALKYSSAILALATTLFFLSGIVYAQNNHPPILSPIGAKEISPGGPLSFSLSATDPDGNSVAYSSSQLPEGASLDPASGSFNWTPSITQLGVYEITFTVTDNGTPQLSSSETVPVRVVFRTIRQEKAWGFGGKNEITMIETTNPEDLYPKISAVEIDSNPSSSLNNLKVSENASLKFVLSSAYDIDRSSISVLIDGKSIDIPSYSDIQTFGVQNNLLSLSFYVSPKGLPREITRS